VTGNCLNGDWTYGYDDFNRVSQATNNATSPNQIYAYKYDRFGNRWQQNYTQGQAPGYQMQLSFNGNNQICSSGYRYDAAGNLVMDALDCYTYDAENRLSSVAPAAIISWQRRGHTCCRGWRIYCFYVCARSKAD